MILSVAFDDAKANQIRIEGRDGKKTQGGTTHTPFFGSRDTPDLPHANLAQRDPKRVSPAHFHVSDQFQVIVDGKGTIGRHNLAPYCVHFSRAYTPYGPLASAVDTGLAFFVMRAHYDPGSQDLPQEQEQLNRVPDRRPWQITRQAIFPTLPSDTAAAEIVLQPIPDMKDDLGLAAYTLSMRPNTTTHTPAPSDGDGQYLIVTKGSLLHQNKEYRTWSLIFIGPKDDPFEVNAGSAGVQAIVLNFPRPQARAIHPAQQARTGLKTWQCALCAFVYDEAAGLPEEGIAPGTRWEDVPETWSCPDCSANKADFQMVQV